MQAHTVFDALQLAVSPVILISACSLLLLSMTNRLGRAIDRAHYLVREQSAHKHIQIKILVRRAKWIRSAILFVAITISLNSLLVLVMFLSVFVNFSMQLIIGLLFILGLLSMGISLCYFIADIFGSLQAMTVDITSIEHA